jgi:hypothetical protein
MVVERITLDDLADRDARKGAAANSLGEGCGPGEQTFALSTPEIRKE